MGVTLRRSRNFRALIVELQTELQSGRTADGLQVLLRCGELAWTTDQSRHLAVVAAATAERLAEREVSAELWWRASINLGAEAQVRTHCLLGLTRLALDRGDHLAAQSAIALVDDTSEETLLLRLRSAVATRDVKEAESAVDDTLHGREKDVNAVRRALHACGKNFELSFRVLRRAFEAYDKEEDEKDEGKKEALFITGLKLCLRSGRLQEADATIVGYVSFRAGDKQRANRRGESYQTVLAMATRHCRNLVGLQKWESVVRVCSALTFLCQHTGDNERKKYFVWHTTNALLRQGQAEKARSLLATHKISELDRHCSFMPLALECAVGTDDMEGTERLLLILARGKEIPSDSRAALYLCLANVTSSLDANGLYSIIQRMLIGSENNPQTKLILIEMSLRLTGSMLVSGEADIEGLLEMVENEMQLFATLDNPSWIADVLWNAALATSHVVQRLRCLTLATRLLEPTNQRYLPTILLTLVSTSTLLESGLKERAPIP